ncbi:MAG: indole-3-glycerol phosphate synthase TrpC [bacterium]|nr:indole-3-glycerol phosphate synthase TrpC [bacterium]
MQTILDRIVETKRREVAAARSALPLEAMADRARAADPPRDFYAAVAGPARFGIHLIAEVKKASPSAGVIRADYDPVAIARLYHQAGASAVSVLTDESFFQGHLDHIGQVKPAVPLPVLRKDFIVDEYQIYQARRHGADAVLLIAEVLEAATIARWADLIADLGMSALIEVHQPDRVDQLLDVVDFAPPARRLLGINNRDLTVQRTDISHTERLVALVAKRQSSSPAVVSESGIKTRADVERLIAAGANAILVGESLLRSDDPARAIADLLGSENPPS